MSGCIKFIATACHIYILQAAGYPSFRLKIIVSVMRDCTVDVMMSELEGEWLVYVPQKSVRPCNATLSTPQ